VGLDSIWLSDKLLTRKPMLDITCMFSMSTRCVAKAEADTVYMLSVAHFRPWTPDRGATSDDVTGG
jgi:hypothetical protein